MNNQAVQSLQGAGSQQFNQAVRPVPLLRDRASEIANRLESVERMILRTLDGLRVSPPREVASPAMSGANSSEAPALETSIDRQTGSLERIATMLAEIEKFV